LLADRSRKPLKITRAANGIDIALPSHAVDPIATVFAQNKVASTRVRWRRIPVEVVLFCVST